MLITHNHYDHMDVPAILRIAREHGARIIAPLGNDTILRRHDPALRVETHDWGDRTSLSDRLTLHFEPSFHWSGRGVNDRGMTLWCSFVITGAEGGVLYHVGDTGYGDGSIFPRIRERYGSPDAALLPIGAYEPRWFMQHQHVDPAEAVQIMLDCGARRAFGHHWGTFQMTYEPREAPRRNSTACSTRAGFRATCSARSCRGSRSSSTGRAAAARHRRGDRSLASESRNLSHGLRAA